MDPGPSRDNDVTTPVFDVKGHFLTTSSQSAKRA